MGSLLRETVWVRVGRGLEVALQVKGGTSLWQWNSTLSNQRSAEGEGVHNALVGQEGHFSVKMR